MVIKSFDEGNNRRTFRFGLLCILFSYETPVAFRTVINGTLHQYRREHISMTTSRHINAWGGRDYEQLNEQKFKAELMRGLSDAVVNACMDQLEGRL